MNSTTDIKRLQFVFEKVMQVEESSRQTFVENECDGNPACIQKVMKMVSFAISNQDLILDTVSKVANEIGQEASLVGTHIDKFKLTQRLGHGGMGDVYLAERSDHEFQQKVAIKIIRDGLHHQSVHTFFQRERQILADLNHPNICHLLDGGTTSDGMLYFVMEFIEGITITEYCQNNNLSLQERLSLFITICHAVQSAHQKLIIHCDIKPDNILVTQEGILKLLDFGIANLTTTETVADWKQQHIAISYSYASPEAMAQIPPSTESDVFSLGILLFELAVQQHPNHLSEETLTTLKKYRHQKPTKPLLNRIQQGLSDASAHITSPQLRAIFSKATHIDPLLRYQTVNELKTDIERYLAKYPVLATSTTLLTRFCLWVRRQMWLAGALLSILALSVLWGYREVNLRQTAETESLKYQKTTQFIVNLFKKADPNYSQGRQYSVKELLDNGREELNKQPSLNPVLDISIKLTIAKAYEALGEYTVADELYKELLSQEQKAESPNWENVAEIYSMLGDNARKNSQFEISRQWQNQALDSLTHIHSNTQSHSKVYNNYGVLELNTSNYVSAQKWFDLADQSAAEFADALQERLIVIRHNQAMTSGELGMLQKAIAQYKEVLKIKEQLFGKVHPRYITTLGNLVHIYLDNNAPETESSINELTNLVTTIYQPDNKNVLWVKSRQAAFLVKNGKYSQAEEIYQNIIQQEYAVRGSTLNYARHSNDLASLYLEIEHYEQAWPLLELSLDIRTRNLPENHWDLGESRINLAHMLIHQNQYQKADIILQQVSDNYAKESNKNGLIATLHMQTHLALITKNIVSAKQHIAQSAVHLNASQMPANSPIRIEQLKYEAMLAYVMNDYLKAQKAAQQALTMTRKLAFYSPLNSARLTLINNDISLMLGADASLVAASISNARAILLTTLPTDSASIRYADDLLNNPHRPHSLTSLLVQLP
ncbi:serine/threonine protein kinase [Paraneptunicella aestuarii]|uniref:protein kinase domain-containing protein n=1 Tax=Paraneptunicella aestuarii TaxID=2831148 RepID=UPI001E5E7AA3|nr:protein kinase [Paraneptunicella aestuarii]UAA39168.1 serine/threonine protein kinase [Paraneptunicella aestuarii]